MVVPFIALVFPEVEMSSLLIANGRVIDPSQDMDRITNLLIENGKIAAFDVALESDATNGVAADRINAAGKSVAPGLIDMHVHLREHCGWMRI